MMAFSKSYSICHSEMFLKTKMLIYEFQLLMVEETHGNFNSQNQTTHFDLYFSCYYIVHLKSLIIHRYSIFEYCSKSQNKYSFFFLKIIHFLYFINYCSSCHYYFYFIYKMKTFQQLVWYFNYRKNLKNLIFQYY